MKNRADLAVHSLKDLPTELPAGLTLGAITKREDPREVLLYRDQSDRRGFAPGLTIARLPADLTVATSSPRRKAQLLRLRPDWNIIEIRGNVPTRLDKLAIDPQIDATVLAHAGLRRLDFEAGKDGLLRGDAVPDGTCATIVETSEMLPCVGQGAIGIEIRENDERIAKLCQRLNHFNTQVCAEAERSFLSAMGGGCQSPVAAHAEVRREKTHMPGLSFGDGTQYSESTVTGELDESQAPWSSARRPSQSQPVTCEPKRRGEPHPKTLSRRFGSQVRVRGREYCASALSHPWASRRRRVPVRQSSLYRLRCRAPFRDRTAIA